MSNKVMITLALLLGLGIGFGFGVSNGFLGDRISLNLVKLKAAQSPLGVYCWTEASGSYCLGKVKEL